VLAVVASLLPLNPAALIPASDQGTQLLLTFAQVSHTANKFAILKLRQHCIFLDSEDRLRRFLVCLEASRESSRLKLSSVFENVWAMYLAPFGSISVYTPGVYVLPFWPAISALAPDHTRSSGHVSGASTTCRRNC
jgi:hypothetical protein